jgi:hypothetical protein
MGDGSSIGSGLYRYRHDQTFYTKAPPSAWMPEQVTNALLARSKRAAFEDFMSKSLAVAPRRGVLHNSGVSEDSG